MRSTPVFRVTACITKGIRDHDFGLRAFVFEDPDGNRIDVGQALRANK